jgi:hypothetical protein
MKDLNEILSLIEDIQELPISEETLGAYIEGSLNETELQSVEILIDNDDRLSQLVDSVKDINCDIESFQIVSDAKFDWDIHSGDMGFWELGLPPIGTDKEINESVMSTNKAFAIYGEDALNQVSDYVRQSYPDTCAIKSQQLVLERFGIHISEEELRTEAINHGWYTPGQGTSMENVGKLLELHGVHVHQYVNGNICNIMNELGQGHEVIMGVDSGELWHYGFKEKMEDLIPGIGGADHALIVSGINTDDPHNVKVIITDPGTGDLRKEYSLSQFVDAANDSHFYMVTTDQAVPNIFDSFGEGIEHLPVIGNMTYDYFVDNYAYLHDVSNRPVFEEFISRMQPTPMSAYLATDYMEDVDSGDSLTDGDEENLDDDIDELDDLDIDF